MKTRVVLSAVLFAFSLTATAALAPAGAQTHVASASTRGLAPADEYFGRLQMSVLGIANTIRDAGTRASTAADPESVIGGPLSLAVDAMHDWQRKYPADPWIAKDLLSLMEVYLRIPTDAGRDLAVRTAAWLIHDYPETTYAAQGKVELANMGVRR